MFIFEHLFLQKTSLFLPLIQQNQPIDGFD